MSDNEFETEAALSDECHIYQQIVVFVLVNQVRRAVPAGGRWYWCDVIKATFTLIRVRVQPVRCKQSKIFINLIYTRHYAYFTP